MVTRDRAVLTKNASGKQRVRFLEAPRNRNTGRPAVRVASGYLQTSVSGGSPAFEERYETV